jgi:8-oxo-dGTP diphosphatase
MSTDAFAGAGTVPCAGGIVFDPTGRLLLIQRGTAPGAGLWSIPGGRCRAGETAADACIREIGEETGLVVRVLRLVGRVERPGAGETKYDIADFLCAVEGGELRAGDDAADARWVTGAELARLPLVADLGATLSAWDCLPRC